MTDQTPPASGKMQDPSGNVPALEPTPATPTITTTSNEKSRSMVREIIETLLLALLIFVLVRAVVLNFRVEGHSMDTSLQNNEMLLVNRNAYLSFDQDKWFGWIPFVDAGDDDIWYPFGTPERGDIVVLNPPNVNDDKPYIKRVIGLPGDTLEIRDDGVYINGTLANEPYIDEGNMTRCTGRMEYCNVEIPEGYVYVMGDNRMNSSDSRTFGLVPIDNIIGKAWITYWPVGELGVVPHYDYPELDVSSS
ncbi:MAG TPA: signal peptidase I [Thermomicrobiales bacterium]|nr:signal peptidase I [Thermomicrobiales bacterium]